MPHSQAYRLVARRGGGATGAEAQGPAPSGEANITLLVPFWGSRHPLNLAPLPVLWLAPTMTVNLAVFNSVATRYSALGSVHEERRLLAS